MATVAISDKGAVMIPAEVRERYGLRPGMRVHIVDYGDVLALLPASSDPVVASFGMLRGGSSLVGSFLAARLEEVARGTADR